MLSRIYLSLLLGSLGVSTPALAANAAFVNWIKAENMEARDTSAYSSGRGFYDTKTRRWHEIKLTGDGEEPRSFYYPRYKKTVFWFESEGSGLETKDRSEVRITGSDIDFGKVYYTSFKIYYPSWASTPSAKDWSIIWQCPQIGADEKNFGRNTSPPLNLQLKDNKLFVRTIQDYKLRKSSTSLQVHSEQLVGGIPRDRWVTVFMRFRMGEFGHYKVWLDRKLALKKRGPIGYRNANNPFKPSLKQNNCSVRFGLYKKGGTKARFGILFDDVKVGNSYELVKP